MDDKSNPRLASGHREGTAPLIVYMHGLGCAGSRDWPPVAEATALSGRASLWIDLAGFGRSGRPRDFSYDLVDQAGLVVELLASYPSPIALVGHSMGGTLAVLVAERLIEQGRAPVAVVLAEPNLRDEDASTSAAVAAMDEDAFVAGWDAWRERIDSAWYRASVDESDPVAYHRSAVSLVMHGRAMLGRFATLPVATKVYVQGGHSGEATRETARLVAGSGIPTVVVAGSGHEFSADDPAGFAAAIAGAIPLDTPSS